MPLAPPPSYNSSQSLTHFFISMDYSDHLSGKLPRHELQGPRPALLKVRKDSHKIRKPPVVPHQQNLVHRPPVIIYMVSPKIIHANPNEFMQLVQRLTGPNSSSSPVSSSSSSFVQDNSGAAISPAARFASLEKSRSLGGKNLLPQNGEMGIVEGVDLSTDIDRITGLFPGILSPGPSSLPPVPPNFFSPPSDPNPLGGFHDFSPVLHGNKNLMEGSFMPSPSKKFLMPSLSNNFLMPSPSNNFLSPNINYSPTPSLDIFNNFFYN